MNWLKGEKVISSIRPALPTDGMVRLTLGTAAFNAVNLALYSLWFESFTGVKNGLYQCIYLSFEDWP